MLRWEPVRIQGEGLPHVAMNRSIEQRRTYLSLTFALGLCSAFVVGACSRGSDNDPNAESDSGDSESPSDSEADTEKDPSVNTGTGGGDGSDSTSSSTKSSTTSSGTGTGSGTGTQDPGPKLGACDRSKTPTLTVNSDVRDSTQWSGVVRLEGDIELGRDVTLTIAAGTTILAAPGASLSLGNNFVTAKLLAEGTKDAPIHLCGLTDTRGSWKGLTFARDADAQSALKFVSVANAGAAGSAALVTKVPAMLDHVEISGSAGHGVWADDFAGGSTDLRIEKSSFALRLNTAGAVHRLPANASLTGNDVNAVELGFDRMESSATFRALNVPYRQLKSLQVVDQSMMTLQAGVLYEVAPDAILDIRASSQADSVLKVEGTMANPVEFRLQEGATGGWGGIRFQQSDASRSSLSHMLLRHAGTSERPALDIQAPIKLDSVTVQEGLNGVRIGAKGVAPDSKLLSVKQSKGRTFEIRPEAWVTIPAGGVFENNEESVIWVQGSEVTLSGTIPKMAMPYHVAGRIRKGDNTELVVAAGSAFEMGEGAHLDFAGFGVEGSFVARGTSAEHITFVGAERTQGYWGALSLGSGLNASTMLEYVDFSDGGSSLVSGMVELGKAFQVTNCSFTNSGGYGIERASGDTTDYRGANTFSGNKDGDLGS